MQPRMPPRYSAEYLPGSDLSYRKPPRPTRTDQSCLKSNLENMFIASDVTYNERVHIQSGSIDASWPSLAAGGMTRLVDVLLCTERCFLKKNTCIMSRWRILHMHTNSKTYYTVITYCTVTMHSRKHVCIANHWLLQARLVYAEHESSKAQRWHPLYIYQATRQASQGTGCYCNSLHCHEVNLKVRWERVNRSLIFRDTV